MRDSGDKYEELAAHFIEEQQTVPSEQAGAIADGLSGVHVADDGAVTLTGDRREALVRLSREFNNLFGTNVAEAILAAADRLDHPVALPASLGLDRSLNGYAEYRDEREWHTADQVTNVKPQPAVWARLFGFGAASELAVDGAPIAERRGVPLDASNAVHEAWIEQRDAVREPAITTGHTWISASEIPDRILSKAASGLVSGLTAAKDRYGPDRARLVVWLRYSAE